MQGLETEIDGCAHPTKNEVSDAARNEGDSLDEDIGAYDPTPDACQQGGDNRRLQKEVLGCGRNKIFHDSISDCLPFYSPFRR